MEKVKDFGDKVKHAFGGGHGAVTPASGHFCIKTFKPHAGQLGEFENVLKTHWQSLKALDLVSDREPLILRSSAGYILEIFEWKMKECMDRAHEVDSLKSSWDLICSKADTVPLVSVPESQDPYAHFNAISLKEHRTMASVGNIVVMTPKEGKGPEVLEKLNTHDKILEKKGMMTARPPMHMLGASGQIIEVVEWATQEKVGQAKTSDEVSNIWSEFHEIADFQTLSQLAEAHDKYALFSAIKGHEQAA